jgi:hypothetical protein
MLTQKIDRMISEIAQITKNMNPTISEVIGMAEDDESNDLRDGLTDLRDHLNGHKTPFE